MSAPSTSPELGSDDVDDTPSATEHPRPGGDGRARLKRRTHHWSRVVHVYTSMVALVVVLFFSLTGITLNHPDWTFGTEPQRTTATGTLPFATTLTADDGAAAGADFLSMAEYVRDELDVVGSVASFDATASEATIAFENPGYRADLFVDLDTAGYELVVEQEGWVAVVNDLHKGRSTGSAWSWVIDVSAGFLAVISLSGLLMQFFLRKRRRPALTLAVVGGLLTALLVWITTT